MRWINDWRSVWGLSLFISVMIITDIDISRLGMAILIWYWLIVVMLNRTKINLIDKVIGSMVAFLGLSLIIWSNGLLNLISFITAIYLGLMLVYPNGGDDLISFLFSIKKLLNDLWYTKSDVVLSFKRLKLKTNWIVQIGVSVLILVILLPLLSSANPIFELYLGKVLEPVNWLIESFLQINLELLPFRFVIFLIVGFISFKLPSVVSKYKNGDLKFREWDLNWTVVIVGLVIGLFILTQIQLYFVSSSWLIAQGITHSQRTREIFVQMVIVSILVIALVYKSSNKQKVNSYFLKILLLELFVVNSFGLKSVWDYISAWGFTQKRLWGVVFVFLMYWVIMLGVAYVWKKIDYIKFGKIIILSVGAVMVLVNVFNFDFLIYHWNPARNGQGRDVEYLTGLSTDTFALIDQIEQVDKLNSEITETENRYLYTRLVWRIRGLRQKYEEFDVRNFNLSEWIAYRQSVEVDIEEMDRKMNYY